MTAFNNLEKKSISTKVKHWNQPLINSVCSTDQNGCYWKHVLISNGTLLFPIIKIQPK